MPLFNITINGQNIQAQSGQTLLEAALENGFYIPTLCHDERVLMYGACGVCVVETESSPRLLRACSTYISDGMVIKTETERVINTRKAALELVLSNHTGDCRPPCALNCPAETDCQGYAGLIANKQYKEAALLIREKLPLPSSIGRVCPHPCETACRRELVEEPVSIAALKYFASDMFLGENAIIPEIPAETGKSVCVVGGGPGGLTAAYFLRLKGRSVTVYDAMPQMGGMLRYGIPEYRLPKNILDKEIGIIAKMGVKFVNNTKIGADVTLDYLRENFDAVVVAIGAWSSVGLRCTGEDLAGVYGGIDFLRGAALGNAPEIGKTAAVVGGGNTAMDACRTAVRLGASTVYVIYRRTRNEMPAEDVEIDEAAEEGVIFKYLTNPIEITGENGKVSKIRLQKMVLGEPDASGRRRPVPAVGEEEELDVDSVIAAIGQTPKTVGLEALSLTKWGTVAADELTFKTNLDGVFAIGDATNNGADIAVTAIGEASKAAVVIDAYLDGIDISPAPPYFVKTEPTADDFAEREKIRRVKMRHRSPSDRKADFKEINYGLSEDEAVKEASRCLECGCADYFECGLIDIANKYRVKPEKFEGEKTACTVNNDHPFINRNPEKCILCGLCVRVCDEVTGVSALGLIGRGFETAVKPAFDTNLKESGCISCGQCVTLCPTGALTEKITAYKQVPLREDSVSTVCSFCNVGCGVKLTFKGRMLLRSLPEKGPDGRGILCKKGRFGFIDILSKQRITKPLIQNAETDLAATIAYTDEQMRGIISKYGSAACAVVISDTFTNEELSLAKSYADALGCGVYSTARVKAEDTGETYGTDESLYEIALKCRENNQTIDDVAENRPSANAYGFAALNIGSFDEIAQKINDQTIKGLIVFSDGFSTHSNGVDFSGLEFLCAGSAYMTDDVQKANVVLPCAGFAETEGTFTGASGKTRELKRAFAPLFGCTNSEILNSLISAGK